jgi:putative transposase
VRAPKANAIAERFVRTIRAECLDWLLIVNRHLERVLCVFARHYNSHRPHRSLDLQPPDPLARQLQVPYSPTALVERRDRLGGLIHEYRAAA